MAVALLHAQCLRQELQVARPVGGEEELCVDDRVDEQRAFVEALARWVLDGRS